MGLGACGLLTNKALAEREVRRALHCNAAGTGVTCLFQTDAEGDGMVSHRSREKGYSATQRAWWRSIH